MPDKIDIHFFFKKFITYLLKFIHYLLYCESFLSSNNHIPLYVRARYLLPLITFNCMESAGIKFPLILLT